MDKQKTKVLFLVETDNDGNSSTLAVFPDLKEGRGCVKCYSHAEQHSHAGYEYFEGLRPQTHAGYMPLLQELVSLGYDLEVLNPDESEPIKSAFTSPSREGRTIIIYQDGGVKVFDQGEDWDTTAKVTNFEPDEMQDLEKRFQEILDDQEMFVIQKALQAP